LPTAGRSRQHVLPVIERPHLAHRLVAHPGDDTADRFQHRVSGAPFGPPVILGVGQGISDGIDLAILHHGHHIARGSIVLHVVNPGADVDQRLELRMRGDILDLLAIDMDIASVADRVLVLFAGSDHGRSPSRACAGAPKALIMMRQPVCRTLLVRQNTRKLTLA
jgi:hypothetical protein